MKKKDKVGLVSNELIKEEIKILGKMFQTLPYEIRGNENSIKKIKKNCKETKMPVSSLWGISVYLDPDLPDDMIKLVSKKRTIIINIKGER